MMPFRRYMTLLILCALLFGSERPASFRAHQWISRFGFAIASSARADEFVLKDGREIFGTVKSEKTVPNSKDKQFVIEIRAGVLMLLNQREIKQHTRVTDPEREYAERMKENQDTVEFHMAIAGWCRQHSLAEYEKAHYERVIELEPDNSVARAALNHTRDKDGRWVQRDVMMIGRRGKINVGGKYRFPEIVALEEAQEQATKERLSQLKEARGWQADVLTGNRRAADSRAKLMALAGPHASSVISELLSPKPTPMTRSEPLPDAQRMLYVEVLTRLADPQAVKTLIRMSTTDPSAEIQSKCLESLQKLAPRAATFAFMQALNSDVPDEINAAARGLEAMKDEVAVLPLIEHVVTKHKRQSGGSNATNVEFGNRTGGFTLGTAKPVNVELTSRNQDVLEALTAITGQDYQYDKNAWLDWYDQQHFVSVQDLRRDP